jgi:DNA-binding winged helix-turn-helix (wHTH) protein
MRLPLLEHIPLATRPEPHPARMYGFGPFELCDAELRKNGVRIKLQEQPYLVLLHLVTNAGRAVTREELQQKLWPADTFVDFDVGLNSAVRKLRQALGDDADEPRYIETLARRGYRFIAPVKESGSIQAAQESMAPSLSLAANEPAPATKPIESTTRPASQTKPYIALALAAVTLVAVGVVAFRHRSPPTPHLATEQRITSNPEEAPVIGAVVSPDGKYVAYADSTGVYFRQIDNGETHALPLPKGGEWVPTSWYPDSTHLLLSSWSPVFSGPETFAPEANPSIWKVSILGGIPQKLVEAANAGSISPDGLQIAYLRGGAASDPRQIWVGNNEGGNPTQVIASSSPHTIPSPIVWSPHGERIAYIRAYQPEQGPFDQWAIETLDVRTRATKVVKISTQFALGLCWGPDGRLFYGYQREGAGERDAFGIVAVPIDEKTGEVSGKEAQLTEGMGVIGGMSISTDGRRLVLWREHATPATFVSEIDPRTRQLQPLRRLTLDQSTNIVSTWTPDSRSIVFISNRSSTFKLYRQAIDQSVPELLVDGRVVEMARLAPDGKHFLYLVEADPEHSPASTAVMKVPLEGGSPTMLLQLPFLADIQCARSPATLCLLLTSKFEVYSFDFNDGQPQKYSLPPMSEFQEWGLAPDGSTLAVILKGSKLFFVDLATKAVHQVKLDEWPQLIAVDWAPDSKSVYIPSRRPNGAYVLLRVEPGGASRVALEGGKTPRYQWAIPAPDGRRLAVQANTGENNVWMVEHF